MTTKYTINVGGKKIIKSSKRNDYRYAVTYLCSINGWMLAGLRSSMTDAETLCRAYSKNIKAEIQPITGHL